MRECGGWGSEVLRSKLDRHPLSFFTVGHLFSKMNEVSICRRGYDDLKMTFRFPYTKRDRWGGAETAATED